MKDVMNAKKLVVANKIQIFSLHKVSETKVGKGPIVQCKPCLAISMFLL